MLCTNGTHLSVGFEARLLVRSFQNLSKLDPSFDILGTVFGDLLQMLLGQIAFGLGGGSGVEGAEDLHGFVVTGLYFEHLF